MLSKKVGTLILTMVLAASSVALATGSSRPDFQATSLDRDDGSPSIRLARLGVYEGNIASEYTTLCETRGGIEEVSVQGAAEISTYDRRTRQIFITHDERKDVECKNGDEFVEQIFRGIDVVDVKNPAYPRLRRRIDVSELGRPTSVAVCKHRRFVAVALAADPGFVTNPSGDLVTVNGKVAFYGKRSGRLLNAVEVGSLPDMVTCTPDGRTLLVANEGEPERETYNPDPPGSVSLIDVSRGVRQAKVTTAGFEAFNDDIEDLRAKGVRIFGPDATVAQDLEPEFIAVAKDSQTAWVTLQENNALARLDVGQRRIDAILPLGLKDHSLLMSPEDSPNGRAIRNGLDPSDRDGGRIIRPEPVFGMYQPDAIAAFTDENGRTVLVTANEGDSRDYDAFSEEFRIRDFPDEEEGLPPLCEGAFPDDIQDDARLGRLKTTSVPPVGFDEADDCLDQLVSYGGRSFSIWSGHGELIYDSGDDFEQITATAFPENFNSQDNRNTFDDRSDDKGPEPEGITVGEVAGETYAFILLERIGGVMVYQVSDPANPRFVQYINNRDFSNGGDQAPEGVFFVSAADSPNGRPFIGVSHEESGTTTLFGVTQIGHTHRYED